MFLGCSWVVFGVFSGSFSVRLFGCSGEEIFHVFSAFFGGWRTAANNEKAKRRLKKMADCRQQLHGIFSAVVLQDYGTSPYRSTIPELQVVSKCGRKPLPYTEGQVFPWYRIMLCGRIIDALTVGKPRQEDLR